MGMLEFSSEDVRRSLLFARARLIACLVTGALALQGTSHVMAQTSVGGIQAPSVPSSNRPSDGRDEDWFATRQMERRQERARETERHKQIVDETRRLLELTAQYRASTEAHGKPIPEDQKLLLQIEKLARDVRDKTRGM